MIVITLRLSRPIVGYHSHLFDGEGLSIGVLLHCKIKKIILIHTAGTETLENGVRFSSVVPYASIHNEV